MNDRVRDFLEEKVKPFLKKENLVLLILGGVLLLVISLPTGGPKNKTEQGGVLPGTGGSASGQSGGIVSPAENPGSTQDIPADDGNLQEDSSGGAESLEDRYREELERELTAFLESIDGVGSVKVMITLCASRELVVDREEVLQQKTSSETDSSGGTRLVEEVTREKTAVYDSSSQEKDPYVVKTIYPRVEGVVVAASGVGTGRIRTDISETVQALFGLDAHKVKVLKMGNISYETGIE